MIYVKYPNGLEAYAEMVNGELEFHVDVNSAMELIRRVGIVEDTEHVHVQQPWMPYEEFLQLEEKKKQALCNFNNHFLGGPHDEH